MFYELFLEILLTQILGSEWNLGSSINQVSTNVSPHPSFHQKSWSDQLVYLPYSFSKLRRAAGFGSATWSIKEQVPFIFLLFCFNRSKRHQASTLLDPIRTLILPYKGASYHLGKARKPKETSQSKQIFLRLPLSSQKCHQSLQRNPFASCPEIFCPRIFQLRCHAGIKLIPNQFCVSCMLP